MKKSKVFLKKFSLYILLSALIVGCDNWMNNDDFFKNIEEEVFEAKAERIETNVRYAIPNTMGVTEPSGNTVQKVGVPFKVNAITSDEYGFYRWFAFLSDDTWDPTPDDDDNTQVPFFDVATSNSKIMYTSEVMLETLYSHALGYDVVSFGDSKNQNESDLAAAEPTTTVTIKKRLNNIVIVPVCVNKISVVESDPTQNKTLVPINKTIKIAFSKQIPLSNFATDEGLSSKITIRHRANGGFGSLDYTDISDRFDPPYFSDYDEATGLGRILVIKLKSNEGESCYLAENSLHEIIIDSSIVDDQGYTMGKDFTLSFTTSSAKDDSAPTALSFSVGPKTPFEYNKIDFNPISKDESKYLSYYSNRVGDDPLFFYMWAGDIASIEDLPDEEQVEGYFIGAKTLIPAQTSDDAADLDFLYSEYIPGQIPSALENGQTFSEIVGSDNGLLGVYDISALPDGLIDMHIYAVDKIGNSGEDADVDDVVRTNAHVLVVKDTTPPEVLPSQIKLLNNITGYLNENTIKELKLDFSDVKDFGKENMISSKVYVMASSKKEDTAPLTDDLYWKDVSNTYTLKGVSSDIEDGEIPLFFWFKDDVGNISNPVTYSNVKYDGTKPVVNSISWAYEDGSEVSSVDLGSEQKKRFIKLNVSEKTSGIKSIKINITGTTSDVNDILHDVKIYDKVPKGSNAIEEIEKNTNDIKLNSPLLLDNRDLYIGDLDFHFEELKETKKITIQLVDYAGNESQKYEVYNYVDIRPPETRNFTVENKKEKNIFGISAGPKEMWLTSHLKGSNYCDVSFGFIEEVAGVQYLTLAYNIAGQSLPGFIDKNLGITINNISLAIDKDYQVSIDRSDPSKILYKIEFLDSVHPVLKSNDGGLSTASISNIPVYSKTGECELSLGMTDFAGNNSSSSNYKIYIAGKADEIDELVISSVNDNDRTGYSTSYYSNIKITNSEKVVEKTPGIERLILENAILTNDTNLKIESGVLRNDLLRKGTDYDFENNNTIVFKNNVLYGTYTLEITNVKYQEANNEEQLKLSCMNMAGFKSEKTSNTLIVDAVKPYIDSGYININNDGAGKQQAGLNSVCTNNFKDAVVVVNLTEEFTGVKKINIDVKDENGTSISPDLSNVQIAIRSTFDSNYILPYTLDSNKIILNEVLKTDEYISTLYIKNIDTNIPNGSKGKRNLNISVEDFAGNTSNTIQLRNIYNTNTEITGSITRIANGTYKVVVNNVYPYIKRINVYTTKSDNHNFEKAVISISKVSGKGAEYSILSSKVVHGIKDTIVVDLSTNVESDRPQDLEFTISGLSLCNESGCKLVVECLDYFYNESISKDAHKSKNEITF